MNAKVLLACSPSRGIRLAVLRPTVRPGYDERNNLNCRMFLRRLTRRTNAFSKRVEGLVAALWLYFAHYNFVRIHGTLRMTPAMAAGVTDHLWTIEELLNAGAVG